MKTSLSAPLIAPDEQTSASHETRGSRADTHAELWDKFKFTLRQGRHLWLIRMRWIAILAIVVTIGVAGWNNWVEDTRPLLLITLFMVAYNTFFTLGRRARAEPDTVGASRLSMLAPLALDIVSLTLLLHWSGGIQNPFAVLFVFHAAIGATFLRPRRACALGAAATLLWSGTVLLEHQGQLQHHPLAIQPAALQALEVPGASAVGLAGYLISFAVMLFGVIYFVRSAEQNRLRAESKALQSERVVLTKERLARIGEISAGVAHTVRNPLQGVINCLDLLKAERNGSNSSSDELFSMMDEGLQRVERVTRQLLVLTRNRHVKVLPTDLSHHLSETVRFMQPRAEEKGITLEFAPRELPKVFVDQEALNEAITSIVDNAIQACSRGDQIHLEAKRLFGTSPSIAISIRDTGPGIPVSLLDKIFDPFFTTKSVGEGIGLGLAIAREVVEGHGGSISVSSELSHGSCFKLTLPLKTHVSE